MCHPKNLAFLLSTLLLVGCGGGSSTGDPVDPNNPTNPNVPILAILAEAPLVESYGLLSNNPSVKSSAVWVGDSASFPGHHYRGIFRFDVSNLPADAKILAATFSTSRRIITGMPDVLLGSLQLDDLAFEGSDLSGLAAMYGYAIQTDFTTLKLSLGGSFKASVKDRLQVAVDDGRTRFNLRAHWDTPFVDNGVFDAWLFDFPDGDPRATLTITYTK